MTSLAQPAPLVGSLPAADGSPRLPHVAYDAEGYPHSDGAPLGQNSIQIDQILYAAPALRLWLRDRFPDACIASDMFLYWRKGDLRAVVAPDVFIAFGVGNHPRLSYKLWEEKTVPAFVLEVLSGTTADRDMGPKRDAYARMGVQELILFDPFGRYLPERIAGFALRGGVYRPLRRSQDGQEVRSRVLGLDFVNAAGSLRIRDPGTGEELLTLEETADRLGETKGKLDETTGELHEATDKLVAAEAELARLKKRLAALDAGSK